MSEKVIKIRRGLSINMQGAADKVLSRAPRAQVYGIYPADFVGVVPKMLVSVGDAVKVGTPLFFDKANPEVLFTSPVAGVVKDVVRAEKRRIECIEVTANAVADTAEEAVELGALAPNATAQDVKDKLLGAGYWPMIIQRPFGIIAKAGDVPRDIFISAFDSAPLGADCSFLLQDELENINAGIAALSKLTSGEVHLGVPYDLTAGALTQVKGAKVHKIKGAHPAGNVGVQIERIAPLAKGDLVWTVDVVHLSMIGRLMKTGVVDFSRTVALVGSCAMKPHYFKTTTGAALSSLLEGNITTDGTKTGKVRVINGNVLCGREVAETGYLGYYNNIVSVIEEGDYYEFLGWALPRFSKFSASRSYFSWLTPGRKFRLDTNTNGGPRAFVANGIYEKVMPMDIHPVYLLKAIMAGDIDKMEQLGIYEVVEEDLALCEFICPSKIEWQKTLRQGITKMIKEL